MALKRSTFTAPFRTLAPWVANLTLAVTGLSFGSWSAFATSTPSTVQLPSQMIASALQPSGLRAHPSNDRPAQPSTRPVTADGAQSDRDNPSDSGPAPRGVTTSPFMPPPANDRTFVLNSGTGLDTGCTYRSGGPLIIRVPVTRYMGETNPDGTLTYATELVADGLLDDFATIELPAFDVDYNASTTPPIQPERDRVSFNGVPVNVLYAQNPEYLLGDNNVWRLNTFYIPIRYVKFPSARGVNGMPPMPAYNEIRIDIDTANAPSGIEQWCTSIDWVTIRIKCMSPIVFVHGNSSTGRFFQSNTGMLGYLRHNRFIDELDARHMVYDNSIDFVPNQDTIANNAAKLTVFLPRIVTELGVDSVHLVAHSKGGLDARHYLAVYQHSFNSMFRVLSLTTLSTPHNGSILADLVVGVNSTAVVDANSNEFVNFPAFAEQVADAGMLNDGYPDLQISSCRAFNSLNLPALPRDTVYCTCGADLDLNSNDEVDATPPEYQDLVPDDEDLQELFIINESLAAAACDRVYQVMRLAADVTISFHTTTDPLFHRPIWTTATFTALTPPAPLPNDILVTIPSALGDGGLSRITSSSHSFTGLDGRTHSGIANRGVAVVVFPWFRQIEYSSTYGDLRPSN